MIACQPMKKYKDFTTDEIESIFQFACLEHHKEFPDLRCPVCQQIKTIIEAQQELKKINETISQQRETQNYYFKKP